MAPTPIEPMIEVDFSSVGQRRNTAEQTTAAILARRTRRHSADRPLWCSRPSIRLRLFVRLFPAWPSRWSRSPALRGHHMATHFPRTWQTVAPTGGQVEDGRTSCSSDGGFGTTKQPCFDIAERCRELCRIYWQLSLPACGALCSLWCPQTETRSRATIASHVAYFFR